MSPCGDSRSGNACLDLPEGKAPQQEQAPTPHLLLCEAEAWGPDWGVGHACPASPVLWEGLQGQAGA